MRPSNAQYRRMDAEPGYTPHPEDQVDSDMEQAQLRLEQLRREKEEVETPGAAWRKSICARPASWTSRMNWATAW